MANKKENHISQVVIEIKVEGNLSDEWSDWFEGMSIIHEVESETLITGKVEDQAALFGLLKKIRDLGLPLISVNQNFNKKMFKEKK